MPHQHSFDEAFASASSIGASKKGTKTVGFRFYLVCSAKEALQSMMLSRALTGHVATEAVELRRTEATTPARKRSYETTPRSPKKTLHAGSPCSPGLLLRWVHKQRRSRVLRAPGATTGVSEHKPSSPSHKQIFFCVWILEECPLLNH